MTDQNADQTTEIARLHATLAAAEDTLGRWEKFFSNLRHDMRGALSPAMLMADRLAMTDDEQKKRAGTVIISAIERASAILDRRLTDPPPENS